MSDYQQIPGNIRSLLATTAQTWSDHAADLATHYALLCDDTNQRLRRCAEYLRRGMRSAAIHLADCQPNLVQAVGSLRFPERGAWADLCVSHGMQAPAVLEVECLEQLKSAYALEKALQPLLSRQRLLAIAKASAGARLEVARMLAAEDPGNSCWMEEIRGLESVRLGEIEVEAEAALRANNNTAIESLWNELTSRSWQLEIPANIHDPLEKAIANLTTARVLSELPSLAGALMSAFAADPRTGEFANLVKSWKEKIATPGVTVTAELAAQIQPALDWEVAEQRRKMELEEVKPLQYLFASSEPPKLPGWRQTLPILTVTLAAVVVICGAIGFYYLHYVRK